MLQVPASDYVRAADRRKVASAVIVTATRRWYNNSPHFLAASAKVLADEWTDGRHRGLVGVEFNLRPAEAQRWTA